MLGRNLGGVVAGVVLADLGYQSLSTVWFTPTSTRLDQACVKLLRHIGRRRHSNADATAPHTLCYAVAIVETDDRMARVTCRRCGMRYRRESGRCPNCGAMPVARWRQTIHWRWQVPLAIGIGLQFLSRRLNPDPASSSDLVAASHFVAASVIFAAIAALLIYALDWALHTLRRRARRRRRAASRE